MSKEKQISIKLNVNTAIRVLEVLDNATAGYSTEYTPERIVLLREVINQIDKELEKAIL